jgi:hypothetical protein
MSADRSQQQGGGLSVTTLLIASAASMTAAVVIHEFWTYGAILGAAITPIIVAVTSELLKKPVDRATRLAEERRERRTATRGHQVPTGAPAPDPRGDDPFGIWQADRAQPWYRRLTRRHLRLGLVTGLLAFAIGAIALTAGELALGGSVGGGERTTLGGGSSGSDEDREREERRDEQDDAAEPGATTPEAPRTTTEEPPAQTTPTPGETQPAPTPTEPAPAPDPAQPTPETPAPAPAPEAAPPG